MPTSTISAKLQAQFVKIWRQTDNFTGDPYDLLDDKTRHFLSVCDSISVTPTQFANLFRLILKGKAQLFFLTKIGRKESYRGMYDKLKRHFDTEKNYHQYYTDWTSSTLTDMRRKMKDERFLVV